MYDAGQPTVQDIADTFGVSLPVIARHLVGDATPPAPRTMTQHDVLGEEDPLTGDADDPLLPSLDFVRAELDREQDSHERRASQVDTKAGLILAAAGVVVAFRAAQPTLLGVLAQVAAAVAGGLAILAFLPRVAGTVSPLALRKRYIHQPEHVTKLVVLDTRLSVHADDEQQLKTKAKQLRRAVLALGMAVALAVLGSILSYAGTGGGSDHQPGTDSPRPPTTSSPSQPDSPTATTGP